jgi:hypothetical protein
MPREIENPDWWAGCSESEVVNVEGVEDRNLDAVGLYIGEGIL